MGLFMALVGLMGGAFGWIVRSTAGAISGLVDVLLILPVILGLFPGTFGTTVAKYLPSNAGESFVASFHNPSCSHRGLGSRSSPPGWPPR